jgi:hypothetical protein
MLGAIISRAEAQVLRLSVLYAVLDQSRVIRPEHLEAALGLWQYADDSARMIFGDRLGLATGDTILEALRRAVKTEKKELTSTEINALFKGRKAAAEIKLALEQLVKLGRIAFRRMDTAGRSVTLWRWVK